MNRTNRSRVKTRIDDDDDDDAAVNDKDRVSNAMQRPGYISVEKATTDRAASSVPTKAPPTIPTLADSDENIRASSVAFFSFSFE